MLDQTNDGWPVRDHLNCCRLENTYQIPLSRCLWTIQLILTDYPSKVIVRPTYDDIVKEIVKETNIVMRPSY